MRTYDELYGVAPAAGQINHLQTSAHAAAPSGFEPSAQFSAQPSMPVAVAAPVEGGQPPLPASGLKVAEVVVYTLVYPIVGVDGFEITQLKLRRLKAREMKGVDPNKSDGKFGAALKFVAAMNGLPDETLDELDAVDVIELVGAASPFLARGTGATPSA